VVWVLVLLSIILTASVLFPGISGTAIVAILGAGIGVGAVFGAVLLVQARRHAAGAGPDGESANQAAEGTTWRMAPLHLLTRPVLSTQRKVGLLVLRGYLLIAFGLVVVRIVQLAIG